MLAWIKTPTGSNRNRLRAFAQTLRRICLHVPITANIPMLWVYRTQWVKLGFWNKTLKNAVKLLVTRSRMAVRCDNAPVVSVKKHTGNILFITTVYVTSTSIMTNYIF